MIVYINKITGLSLFLGVLIGLLVALIASLIYMFMNKKDKQIASSDYWSNIFNELGIPVLLISKERIYDANKASINFFKAENTNQIIGKSPLHFLPENYHHYFLKRLKQIKSNRSANIASNYQFIRVDGEKVSALVHAEPISFKEPLMMQVIIIESDHILNMNHRLQQSERRIRDLILHLNEGIAVFKPIPDEADGLLVFSNKRFVEYLTGESKTNIYMRFSDLFKHLIDEEFETIFNQSMRQFVKRELYDSGSNCFYQTMFYMNHENQLVVHMVDITSEKNLIDKYIAEKRQVQSILDATNTILWSFNKSKNKVSFHQKSLKKFNLDFANFDDAIPESLINYCHPEDREILHKYLYTYEHASEDYFSFNLRFRDKSDNYHWMLIRGQVVENGQESDRLISGTMQDITKDKENEEALNFLNRHDYLTEVYNLRAYEKMAEQLDFEANYPISVVLLDVNGLKVFNDAFSHSVGDQLLVETAKVLKKFREKNDVIARIGGDEFIYLMPNTPMKDGEQRFKKIIKSLSDVKIQGIPISIAYGIVEKFNGNLTMSQIKNMADSKMYLQKFKGSNTRIQILKQIRDYFFAHYDFEKQVVNRVHQLAMELGKKMELDYSTMTCLDIASEYYNIGIFGIREEVFNNEREFKQFDFIEYRKHVENGYRILLATHQDERIARSVLHHHEKYNGEGYPGNMKGKEIPLPSRIIAVLATYARKRLLNQSEEEVRAYIDSERLITYDPDIVDEFYKLLDEKNA